MGGGGEIRRRDDGLGREFSLAILETMRTRVSPTDVHDELSWNEWNGMRIQQRLRLRCLPYLTLQYVPDFITDNVFLHLHFIFMSLSIAFDFE